MSGRQPGRHTCPVNRLPYLQWKLLCSNYIRRGTTTTWPRSLGVFGFYSFDFKQPERLAWQAQPVMHPQFLFHKTRLAFPRVILASRVPKRAYATGYVAGVPLSSHSKVSYQGSRLQDAPKLQIHTNWKTLRDQPLSRTSFEDLLLNNIPSIRHTKFLAQDECKSLVDVLEKEKIVCYSRDPKDSISANS